MRPNEISDINRVPRFLLTLQNAYFQDGDFSLFTGLYPREGELYRSLMMHGGQYAYLPFTSLLTIAETLGSLLNDKPSIKANLNSFIAEFMPEYLQHADILYVLRNTVVHEWEGGTEVMLDICDPAVEHMQWNGNVLTINVVSFYKDLKQALQAMTLKSELDGEFLASATRRLKKKADLSALKASRSR